MVKNLNGFLLSGVPQGSVMSPILFVIFTNPEEQIIEHLATVLSKFADDTKTGRPVNKDKDRLLLQEALDTLVKWAEDWFGKINKQHVYCIQWGAMPQQELF